MPHGPNPDWLARQIARRSLPGCCAHCGGPHPDKGPGRLKCPKCKRTLARWRERNRKPRPAIDGQLVSMTTLLVIRRFQAELNIVKNQISNVRKIKQMAYQRGYQGGRRLELSRQQREAVPWKAWEQEVGIEEQKRQSHRVGLACDR
jgi:hypothetical protein